MFAARSRTMFNDSVREVIRHADIDAAIGFASEDVDVVIVFFHIFISSSFLIILAHVGI